MSTRLVLALGAVLALAGSSSSLFSQLPRPRKEDYEGLKIFIYDLPSQFTEDVHLALQRRAAELGLGCDWMLSACSESSNHLFTVRRQFGHEVIILRKFLANPLPVSDPKDADIFVVPALIASACMGGLYDTHCTTPMEEFGDDLFEMLPFYNAETRHRHLFLGSFDKRSLPMDIQAQSVLLSSGASWGDRPGHLVIPPSVTDVELQVASESTGEREILFFMAMAPNNPIRREIRRQLEAVQGSKVVLQELDRSKKDGSMSSQRIIAQMRSSIFCIAPPAENTAAGTKRMFDAILSGCIPVVISFPTIWGSGISWWRADGAPIEWSLPFPSEIQWRRLVLEVSEAELLKGSYGLLFAAFRSDVEEKQRYIAEVRDLLVYDLAGGRRDAFSLVMDSLRGILPRLYRAAMPLSRPLVCEIIPLQQDLSEAGAKGWSSSYGQFACDPMAFWHRCSDFWNSEKHVEPLKLSGFLQRSLLQTPGGRQAFFYNFSQEFVKNGFEHRSLFTGERAFIACSNPRFPSALHMLNATEQRRQVSYVDATECRIPPLTLPRPGRHAAMKPLWQLVFAVCNTMAWENTQDVAVIVEDHWVLPFHDFELVAYDACSQDTLENVGSTLVEHLLTLKMQQEQGLEIPEVVVFFAGMMQEEVDLHFQIIDRLQEYFHGELGDVGDGMPWMVSFDGHRAPGLLCDGFLTTFRSKCPAHELEPLIRSSPHVLAFNTTILNRVPEVHLQVIAAESHSFHAQIDFLTLLSFKAIRSLWRAGHGKVIADRSFGRPEESGESECSRAYEQAYEDYIDRSGFHMSYGNQVLRMQAFGCLLWNGSYSLVDTGLPSAFYTSWAYPSDFEDSVKMEFLKTAWGANVHNHPPVEEIGLSASMEEIGVFGLCHPPICQTREVIQLAWHFLTNVLMQGQRMRPNWAVQNCPDPPPNAKLRWQISEMSDSKVLGLTQPEQFDLWQQERSADSQQHAEHGP